MTVFRLNNAWWPGYLGPSGRAYRDVPSVIDPLRPLTATSSNSYRIIITAIYHVHGLSFTTDCCQIEYSTTVIWPTQSV